MMNYLAFVVYTYAPSTWQSVSQALTASILKNLQQLREHQKRREGLGYAFEVAEE